MANLPLLNPNSVIQISPMSGVYATPHLTENEFTSIIMAYWIKRTLRLDHGVSETIHHFYNAQDLYSFYRAYQSSDSSKKAAALHTLYTKACINTATAVLKSGESGLRA